MNKVRKIQVSLVVVMIILIAIVILNFNSTHGTKSVEIAETNPATQSIESGGTRMEGGVHVLYRNGSPYATVHFKEAIQRKDTVSLSSPLMQIAGALGELAADSAELQGNVVLLQGKISLSSTENGISVSLTPPATFKEGILTGAGAFQAKLNGGVFMGKGYVLRVADSELIGKDEAQFNNSRDSFHIRSKSGIANLKEKTLAFAKEVRLTGSKSDSYETRADAAFLDTGIGRISLVGRGEIILSPLSTVRFSEAILWHQGSKWSGIFPTSLNLQQKRQTISLPTAALRNDRLSFPWSLTRSKTFFMNTGPGSYSFRSSNLQALAPSGQHKDTKITGRDISGIYSKNETSIMFPEIHKKGLGRVTGNYGRLKNNGVFSIEGNVYGEVKGRQFLSDSALMAKKNIQLKNAIVWDGDTRSFSSAGVMKLGEKNFIASRHYHLKQLREKGASPLNLSSQGASGSQNGPSHLIGNVQATLEGLRVKAPQSYVYRWGVVFFDAAFTGPQIKNGQADLLIVLKKSHVIWMLGNAEVTDRKGNRIIGHKLTLSTITGRISVYRGKKKVRIELAL